MPAPDTQDGPSLTIAGKLFVLLIVAASLYGAYFLYAKSQQGAATSTAATGGTPTGAPVATPTKAGPVVHVGLAYGTEKKRWLESAAADFSKTPQGTGIEIELIPLGSLEGAQSILRADDAAKKINAWAPASSLYKPAFVQDWQDKFGNNPIAREEQLALTPMVFVFWEERFNVFHQKYPDTTFRTIAQALAEPGGWDAIAGKPTNWGFFKFGHTHPNKSNSGLVTLVLMAYDFNNKSRGLSLSDVTDAKFQSWMSDTERGASGMIESTGTLMRDMVLKGPSTYDCLFVYESVVIDYLKNAEGRSGRLHVEYPQYNLWNDNPYYVLDTPWTSAEQKRAAGVFLDYLLSEPVQQQALVHGFRPGNPNVAIKLPDSPFVKYVSYGLKPDLPVVCEPPKPEILSNLLLGWQRSQGNR